MEWPVIVDRWALVVADFHRILGVDIEDGFESRSFRWFEVRLAALLSFPDSLLARSLQADRPAQQDGPPVDIGEGLAA